MLLPCTTPACKLPQNWPSFPGGKYCEYSLPLLKDDSCSFSSKNAAKVERRGYNIRLGATSRDAEATSSSSSSRGLHEGFPGMKRRRSPRCFPGDLEDDGSPVASLEDNVSLAELLRRVGAGEARNARGEQVQIEANPHPSVLRRYTELSKPYERGRALPIPMPHKLQRPLTLPRSRRRSLPSNKVRKCFTSSTNTQLQHSYPKLLAKILVTPYDAVWKVLDSWKGKSKVRSGALAIFIREVGRLGSIDKALQVFAWVREQPHLWPDDRMVLAIVQTALELREVTLANNLLALYGPLSSSKSSCVLADMYAEHGLVRDAVEVLLSSEKEGLCSSADLYVKLIVKAGQTGAKGVVRAFLAGRNFNLQLEDCTRVMATCSKLGLDEEVEALFLRYRGQGYKPNIVMFTTLMKARARAGKVREAVGLFWELEEAGVKPDLIACRVMIHLCDTVRDLGKAVKVYNHMKAVGLVPTSDVYNILIRLYCKDGRRAKAREVMREMEMWGCAPTAETHDYLLAARSEQS